MNVFFREILNELHADADDDDEHKIPFSIILRGWLHLQLIKFFFKLSRQLSAGKIIMKLYSHLLPFCLNFSMTSLDACH